MGKFTQIDKPEMTIVGIECRTSNDPSAGPHDIPKLWEKFFQEKIEDQVSERVSEEIIALYCDYEGDYTRPYSLVIGYEVKSAKNLPSGLVVKKIPASRYAVFHAKGEHPKSLIELWGKIWNTKLPRTYSGDFEVYGGKFLETPKQVDVFIAIKSAA